MKLSLATVGSTEWQDLRAERDLAATWLRELPPGPIKQRQLRNIQRRVRRLLIVHGEMTTPQLRQAIYGSPTKHWQYRPVGDAARKFAIECGRRRSAGAPIVWRLK
jgi:hypothetical protein